MNRYTKMSKYDVIVIILRIMKRLKKNMTKS